MTPHTATGEWKSFELRMRQRRVDRLLLRADVAMEYGCHEDARACLAEARQLAPELPAIDEIQQRFDKLPAIGYPLPASGSQLPASGFRLPAFGLRLSACALIGIAAFVGWPGAHDTPARGIAATDLRGVALAIASPVPKTAAFRPKTQATQTPSFRARTEAEVILPFRPKEAAAVSDAGSKPDVPVVGLPPSAEPPSAAAPPALPLAPAPAAPAIPVDREEVRQTLDRYAAAYSALDAAAAQRVWPGVNRAALSRAFDALASQRVSLGECRIDVRETTARARCAGSATWSARIGDGSPRTETREWTFDLVRAGVEWQILSARAQNR